MLEALLLVVTVVLAGLAITGYDQYLATKVRNKLVRDKLRGAEASSNLNDFDSVTKMRVKKVKATKIGSYLVITLVISDSGRGGEEIEISDPTLLLPLLAGGEESKEEIT